MADEKKARRPTARKRDIQNAKRRLHNRSFKSRVKTAIRSLEKDVIEKNSAGAQSQLSAVFSLLDKGVKMGIYKLNKASRLKSKFTSNTTHVK